MASEVRYVDVTQEKLNGGLADTGSPQDIDNDQSPCLENVRLGEYGSISEREWVLEKVGDNDGVGAVLALTQIEIHERCGQRNDGIGQCEDGSYKNVVQTGSGREKVFVGEKCTDKDTEYYPYIESPCPFDSCTDVSIPNPKGTGIMVLVRAVESIRDDETSYTSLEYFEPATKDMKDGVWYPFASMNGVHYFKMETDGSILWFSNEETDLQWACFSLNGEIIGTISMDTAEIEQSDLTNRAKELGYSTLQDGYILIDANEKKWVYRDGSWDINTDLCRPKITTGVPTCKSEYRNNGQPLAAVSAGNSNLTDTWTSLGSITISGSLAACDDDWQKLVKYVQTHPRFLGTQYKYQACPRNGASQRYCYTLNSSDILKDLGKDNTDERQLTQEEITEWEQKHKESDGGQVVPGQDNDDEWDYDKVLDELKAPDDIKNASDQTKEAWIYSHGWTLKEAWTLAFTEKYRIPNPDKANIFLWLCNAELSDNTCTNYDTITFEEKESWIKLTDVEIPDCLNKTIFWYAADEHTTDANQAIIIPAGTYRKYAITWDESDKSKGYVIYDNDEQKLHRNPRPGVNVWAPRYCCDENKKLAGEGKSGIRTNFLTKYAHRLFAIQNASLIYGTKSISNTGEYVLPSGMGDFLDRGTARTSGETGTTFFDDKSGWPTHFSVFDGKPKIHYYSPAGPRIYVVQYVAGSDNRADEFQMVETITSSAASGIYAATNNSSIDYYISSFYGVNETIGFGIFQNYSAETSKIVSGKIKQTMSRLDTDRVAVTNFNGLLLIAVRRRDKNKHGCSDDDFAIGCLDNSSGDPAPNNIVLTYNIGLDAWVPWGPMYISCWHEFREKGTLGTVKKRLLAGDPRFHQVYQLVKGTQDYTTTSPGQSSYVPPEMYWESKQLNLGIPQKGKQIKGLVVSGYIGPGAAATIGIRLDCQDNAQLSRTFTYDSVSSCVKTSNNGIPDSLGCRSCTNSDGTKEFKYIIDLANPKKFMTISLYVYRHGGEFEISNYALLLNKITDAEAWDIARKKSTITYVGETDDSEYYVNGYPDF